MNDHKHCAGQIGHGSTGPVNHAEIGSFWGRFAYMIALLWAVVQLWLASPLPFVLGWGHLPGMAARAVHLGFAFALAFVLYRCTKTLRTSPQPSPMDLVYFALGLGTTIYLAICYNQISQRAGLLEDVTLFGYTIAFELWLGAVGLACLLEATRRTIGWPLVCVALAFLIYSVFGPYFPDILAHQGMSLQRLVAYQWFTGEAVFGIPLGVSVRFIFLFVVFGALLDRAGAGQYFIELAMSLVGHMRGGPAKASVLASGLTGMISGSSIANTVTTGTFTIPLMTKSGISREKAGAIEVAASVNGQIMPPIMGAAAFVIAELIGISYFDVVYHAFIPAVISYLALFYITDIEARKLGLKPEAGDKGCAPQRFMLKRGAIYFMPLVLLVYLLIVARMTTGASVFWAIVFLMAIMMGQSIARGLLQKTSLRQEVLEGLWLICDGLVLGARNMVPVVMALAAAGIVVGAVASTGLSNQLSIIVEQLAGQNIYLLLALVALLSIILGMGLPTTANYLVVASLMVPVIIGVGAKAGFVLPLIAVHLFVFYFGLMADVTPPVALAAYAASGISKGDPFKTGLQAFFYSIRTAILPFIFVFNLDLLLIGVTHWWEALMIFFIALIAMFAFTALTFRFMARRLSWFEMAVLALVAFALFRPALLMNQISKPTTQIALSQLVTGVDAQSVTLHIRRGNETKPVILRVKDYEKLSAKTLGLSLTQKEGGYVIEQLQFMGVGEIGGLMVGDQLSSITIANPQRLSRRWIYLPAVLLFFFIWWRQYGAGWLNRFTP